MEFSYKFSKQICVDAFRFMYWTAWQKIIFIFLLAMTFWEVIFVCRNVVVYQSVGMGIIDTLTSPPTTFNLMFLITFGLWSVAMFLYPWWKAVHYYRKSPMRDRIITASVTSEHIELKFEDIASSCTQWSFYKYWQEGKNTFVMALRSGGFQFFPKTGLNEAQRVELRGILAAVLPKK